MLDPESKSDEARETRTSAKVWLIMMWLLRNIESYNEKIEKKTANDPFAKYWPLDWKIDIENHSEALESMVRQGLQIHDSNAYIPQTKLEIANRHEKNSQLYQAMKQNNEDENPWFWTQF